MNWFRNLKIAHKLIIGFFIVTLLTIIIGTVGVVNITKLEKANNSLYEENTIGISNSGIAAASFQRLRYNYLMLFRATSIDDKETRQGFITALEGKIETALRDLSNIITDDSVKGLVEDITSNYREFEEIAKRALDTFNKGNVTEANDIIMVDSDTISIRLFNQFDELTSLDLQSADKKALDNSKLAVNSKYMTISLIAGSVVISIALGIFISRIIEKPLNRMGKIADRLAIGDTNVQIDIDTNDETGKLAKAFQRMLGNIKYQVEVVEQIADGNLTIEVLPKSEVDTLGIKLKEMVTRNRELLQNISVASDHIASSAKHVSDSSIVLSQGAAEQASSIEELTASLEEISMQTNMNAQKAGEANINAMTAQSNADIGTIKMQEMLQAMDQINDSSSSISKVIKVIDDIAFQTNILALNAAVEAARAGHLGKGFAVVAEEVRNLAARSASAAKETTDMIANSIQKSEVGTKIARETAESLNLIVTSIKQANSLVTEIAHASNDQAMSLGQINIGIEQVLSVVQSNSATSEENAASSEELAAQSDVLKDTVSKYKL